ncbi:MULTISPECIES: hypothetical protein [Burkholderia]|jgi:hypothetical protein|uniref:Uncharacterized protein n=2 Tax=Burkholderia cepacia complex TaxID=87882 RepID=B4E781_BURCJ|nr:MULTISPECIES: hypothetical protein [Burkholderia]KIS46149.1 hypothetical protein NP88_4640 [Burkholderia cepacia]AOJ92230.1 hypothetical protein WK22_04525 [Burkholderia multivorans]ERI30168.1 hypothetical protein BURCENBC7_AP1211 [Burkholderia cenocepacia BC7]KOE22441.1 hypothetical protein AI46_29940 [Burkholderia multivorans R-20526]MBU9348144.1 hypothetical protein [Burkholderia multivorans]
MLIQKFHPGLRLGRQPVVAASGNPIFSRQGHWDGGSTLHGVAMGLALLGKLADPIYLPYHVSGPEQVVWDDAWPHYLSGMTMDELANFVTDLSLGVRAAKSAASGIDFLRFIYDELLAGWPVIIGWHQRHVVKWRAALVVGIEGHQSDGAFEPHAILLIDPAGNEPGLAGFNARLDRHGSDLFRYRTPAAARAVKLMGGVAIRDVIGTTADT